MSGRGLRFALGALSVGGVAWFVWVVATERPAPGPVALVHAQLPDLDGGQACSACHGGWFTSMQEACLECHGEVAAQLQQRAGLHGLLAGDACAKCHSEHHGAAFQLVNRLSFALAGVADPKAFDHDRIGFLMRGPHLEQACDKCHPNADTPVLAAGSKRYLGLSQDCSKCHEDVHRGAMALPCAACHGQLDWKKLEPLDHDRFVPLVGGHGGLECTKCHADRHAFERLGRRDSAAARVCVDCHESLHTPQLVAGVAQQQGVAAGAACGVCHLPAHLAFRGPDAQMTVAHHALTGFPLTAPHAEVACGDCHAAARGSFRDRYPGRLPDGCVVCHADPHGGQFHDVPAAALGCVGCHARDRWQPATYGLREHARTALPLDGKHAEIECNECHVEPRAGEPRRYRQTPPRCESCHTDVHPGAFARIDAQLDAERRGRCANCHVTTSFSASGPQPFDHGRSTGFAITGAHEQIECEDCHPRQEQPDAHGRSFGRAAPPGAFKGCPTCHVDPHAGRFDGRRLPAKVSGRTGCERCHDTVSFRALPYGFDHGIFASFPLDGAHERAACTACHERLPAPGKDGRTWAPARGKVCADCHQEPHAGQFARDGKTSCERCHRSAVSFQTLVFQHDRDSRFALGDAHAKVRCDRCHRVERIGDASVVRYRPLAAECVACHDPQGGPVRLPKPVGR